MSEGVPSFTDEESALILQRAGELQAQQGRNLSLPELEAAAAEAGIDAALVLRAAQELATRPAPQPVDRTFGGPLGAPLQLVHERTVLGEGSGTWDDEIAEIRRLLSVPGRVELIGRTFTWRSSRGRTVRVSIVPRGGRRLVRVEERVGDLAGGLYLGMGLPVTFAGLGFILPICIVVLELPVLIPLAIVVWGVLAFLLARTIFKSIVRQRDGELRELAEALVEVCTPAAALTSSDGER